MLDQLSFYQYILYMHVCMCVECYDQNWSQVGVGPYNVVNYNAMYYVICTYFVMHKMCMHAFMYISFIYRVPRLYPYRPS